MRYAFEMIYPVLAIIFFISLALALALVLGLIFKSKISLRNRRSFLTFYLFWFVAYSLFILFFTGPKDLTQYPSQAASPYKLPWKAGDSRFVAQGNNSFISHRGDHKYAWDFAMPLGTEIRASRAGHIRKIEDHFEGIGFNSNFIAIEHENGESIFMSLNLRTQARFQFRLVTCLAEYLLLESSIRLKILTNEYYLKGFIPDVL